MHPPTWYFYGFYILTYILDLQLINYSYVWLIEFQAQNVEVREEEFNPEFVARMLPKIDWDAMYQAADSVSQYKI